MKRIMYGLMGLVAFWCFSQIAVLIGGDDGDLAQFIDSRVKTTSNSDQAVVISQYPRRAEVLRHVMGKPQNPNISRSSVEMALQEMSIRFNANRNLSATLIDLMKELNDTKLNILQTKVNLLGNEDFTGIDSIRFLADVTVLKGKIKSWEDDIKSYQTWKEKKDELINAYLSWLDQQISAEADKWNRQNTSRRNQVYLLLGLAVGLLGVAVTGVIFDYRRRVYQSLKVGHDGGFKDGLNQARLDLDQDIVQATEAIAQKQGVSPDNRLAALVDQANQLVGLEKRSADYYETLLETHKKEIADTRDENVKLQSFVAETEELRNHLRIANESRTALTGETKELKNIIQQNRLLAESILETLAAFKNGERIIKHVSEHLLQATIIGSRIPEASDLVRDLEKAHELIAKLFDETNIQDGTIAIRKIIKSESPSVFEDQTPTI